MDARRRGGNTHADVHVPPKRRGTTWCQTQILQQAKTTTPVIHQSSTDGCDGAVCEENDDNGANPKRTSSTSRFVCFTANSSSNPLVAAARPWFSQPSGSPRVACAHAYVHADDSPCQQHQHGDGHKRTHVQGTGNTGTRHHARTYHRGLRLHRNVVDGKRRAHSNSRSCGRNEGNFDHVVGGVVDGGGGGVGKKKGTNEPTGERNNGVNELCSRTRTATQQATQGTTGRKTRTHKRKQKKNTPPSTVPRQQGCKETVKLVRTGVGVVALR